MWKAVVVDYDDSISRHVALLEGNDHDHNNRAYAVALESKTPYPFKEGERVYARIEMECEEGVTIDEAMSDKFNQWIHYIKMGCNAKKVEYLYDSDF